MSTNSMVRAVGMFALTMALAVPAEARSQTEPDVETAVALEAEAYRLHTQSQSWADAAGLYKAAADLRQHEDPVARQDLFLAANLFYQAGDKPAAIAALESAATRALSGGDPVFASEMYSNAAKIADEAGLTNDQRRLSVRASEVAGAARTRTQTRS